MLSTLDTKRARSVNRVRNQVKREIGGEKLSSVGESYGRLSSRTSLTAGFTLAPFSNQEGSPSFSSATLHLLCDKSWAVSSGVVDSGSHCVHSRFRLFMFTAFEAPQCPSVLSQMVEMCPPGPIYHRPCVRPLSIGLRLTTRNLLSHLGAI